MVSYDAFMVQELQTFFKIKTVLLYDSDLKYNYYTSEIKTLQELFNYLEDHREQLIF